MITPGAANGGSEQQTRRGGIQLFSPEFMLNNQFTEHCFSLQAEGQLQFYSPAADLWPLRAEPGRQCR